MNRRRPTRPITPTPTSSSISRPPSSEHPNPTSESPSWSRVRNLVRSEDLRDRYHGLRLVLEARQEGYPHIEELHDEAPWAPGSAEWNSSATPTAFRDAYLPALHAIGKDSPDMWDSFEHLLEAVRSTGGVQ